MPKPGFPTPFDGGLPLRSEKKKKFPGKGLGARGETLNPEMERKRRSQKLRKKGGSQTKRPAVGR